MCFFSFFTAGDKLTKITDEELEKKRFCFTQTTSFLYGEKRKLLSYYVNDNQLKAVSKIKALGVYITSNLSWSMQVNKCANKANSVLGFIKRTVGPKNPELFLKLYKSLVRPILEYCSPVWCPHLKKDSSTLKKGQLRPSECRLGNIGRDMSYEESITGRFFKWSEHKQRFFLSLIECYKTLNRLTGLDPSAFFTFAHNFQQLRPDHRFKVKFASASCVMYRVFIL